MEKDTKVTIFKSKKFQFLSHSYLKQGCFLCFCVYRFVFFASLFLHLSFLFLSIPLHISFYFYFRFGSIFVYLTACSLFFYESLLYAEKVEEDTKAVIFYSKKVRFLNPFYLKEVCFFISLSMFSLFLCFSQSFHFFGCPPFILFS